LVLLVELVAIVDEMDGCVSNPFPHRVFVRPNFLGCPEAANAFCETSHLKEYLRAQHIVVLSLWKQRYRTIHILKASGYRFMRQ
jgi:hypothetical protein